MVSCRGGVCRTVYPLLKSEHTLYSTGRGNITALHGVSVGCGMQSCVFPLRETKNDQQQPKNRCKLVIFVTVMGGSSCFDPEGWGKKPLEGKPANQGGGISSAGIPPLYFPS